MVWKQPEISELDVNKEIKDLMNKGVYYNSEGNLADASLLLKLEYIFFSILTWIGLVAVIRFLLSLLSNGADLSLLIIVIASILFICIFVWLYIWGWRRYEQAWYHFDHLDELLTVIKDGKHGFEVFEIPYEDVHEIEWYDGPNGKAIIKAASFEFSTNRYLDKRLSSVTEMWDDLARINSKMVSWPIQLLCPKCYREFGSHTGTGICPFDEVILIDPKVKGRIDPEEIHPDDFDRL
ncbi:MAG: hypothetical protein INQ03_25330 [Candidatus Heimdallarchaeota archaeon]|nr:hypothetical protein [Candidatus Heimdallarchaeota archaeon]